MYAGHCVSHGVDPVSPRAIEIYLQTTSLPIREFLSVCQSKGIKMAAESTTPKLFNVAVTDVTSSTRATWSKANVESFENFIDANDELDGECV